MRSKLKKLSIISSIVIILFLITSLFVLHINKVEVSKLNIANDIEKLAIEENTLYKDLKEEFADSTNCQYDTIDNGNIIITEYYGDKDSVIIPEEINGIKVEKISEDAFFISENLEIIKIPIEIAENIYEINGFERSEQLSNEEYIVFKTTNEYTEIFLQYRNLSDEEKKSVLVIPRKFVETRKETNQQKTLMKANANINDANASLPTSFDLRRNIQIYAGNQGALGICYAYATNKSIETNIALKYRERVDLSEIDLAMRSRQLYGGNFIIADFYYFRPAIGPIRERAGTLLSQSYIESYRYNNNYASTIWNACLSERTSETLTTAEEQAVQSLASISGNPEYYVMSYEMFGYIDGNTKRSDPVRTENNRNKLKESIMNYGSAYTYVMMDTSRYTMYNGRMVMNCTGSETIGAHAVSIIGWDDNFSRYNFPSNLGVTQDGAWLALNSWESTWGNGDGTFWISYQDGFVETDNYVVKEVSKDRVDISDTSKVSCELSTNVTVNNGNIYNGKEKTPTTIVKYKTDTLLIKDTDYTVTYSNNINAGVETATVTITGKGRYKGTITKKFTIQPKNINTTTVTLAATSYSYDGTSKTPAPTVKDGDKTLVLNRDYTVTYNNNIDAGTATITITGKGNYTGTATKTFTITGKNISETTITLAEMSYIYDGTAKTPSVTIKDGNKTLTLGYDYDVWYENNVNAGTATVKIKGFHNYYSDSITRTFTINPRSISTTTVTLEETSYVYDGTEKKPAVTVKIGDKILILNRDYEVTYSNNTNIGRAIIIITGEGNCAGIISKTFTIEPKNISTATVTLGATSYVYDGTAKTPTVTVKNGDTTLVLNEDYTISYSNNTNVGTATITITGKGIYTGTVSKTFTITPRNINTATLTLEATSCIYDGTAKIPVVTVKDGDTRLILNEDYAVNYSNNTNVGTATITIVGKGNYIGTLEEQFGITPKNINTATVLLEETSYIYDGTEKTPTVTVKNGDTTLTLNEDYTIKYTNNTNAGTATIIIIGKGNYAETSNVAFKIEKGNYPYTIPSGLTAIYNSTLKDIKLPKGFSWEDDLDTKVGEAGYNTFKCTYTPEDIANYNIVIGIDVVVEVKEKLSVLIEEYSTEIEKDNRITYLKGIEIGETLGDVKNRIKTNGVIEISEKDGIKISDKNKICKTGMKVKITKEKESVEYTLVVVGDNNGDGKITITDVVRANLYLTHLKELQGEFAKAVDINNDGRVTITDIVKVKLKSVHM